MKRMIVSIGILTILAISIFQVNHLEDRCIQEAIAGKVIRFHVLANSDSKKDQALKLKVRDEVSVFLQKELRNMKSVEETEAYINKNLSKIEKVAEETIHKHGKDYKVSARLCQSDFPVKTYEGYTFPEGRYEALRIVIGEGEGHNWWCVMYPNLCFSKSIYKWNKNEWKRLKDTLSPKEYFRIMDSKKFTIRWKFLEYFRKKG